MEMTSAKILTPCSNVCSPGSHCEPPIAKRKGKKERKRGGNTYISPPPSNPDHLAFKPDARVIVQACEQGEVKDKTELKKRWQSHTARCEWIQKEKKKIDHKRAKYVMYAEVKENTGHLWMQHLARLPYPGILVIAPIKGSSEFYPETK